MDKHLACSMHVCTRAHTSVLPVLRLESRTWCVATVPALSPAPHGLTGIGECGHQPGRQQNSDGLAWSLHDFEMLPFCVKGKCHNHIFVLSG